MKKFKAVFLQQEPSSGNIDYVYSPEQKAVIAGISDLYDGVAGPEDIAAGRLKEVEVIFSTWGMINFTPEQLAAMPGLKAVFYAAGATDYFIRPLLASGIHVYSAWRANAIPVAEFCVAQILLGMKGYFRASRELTGPGRFNHSLAGCGNYGGTVALIGAGAISAKVQELLKNFNLNVTVVPSRKENRTVSLEEAFARANVVSNHLPDRDDNAGVLDGKLFRSMPEGAVFINTGRGRQVNEAELIQVLKERSDLTALLDVTYPEPPAEGSELYSLPNVVLSPHIAGSINDEVHRMADYMIDEYKRFAAGEKCLYEVNESILITSKR